MFRSNKPLFILGSINIIFGIMHLRNDEPLPLAWTGGKCHLDLEKKKEKRYELLPTC